MSEDRKFRVAKNKHNLATAPWRNAVGIELMGTLLGVPPVICWFTRGAEEYAQMTVDALNRLPAQTIPDI